MHIRNITEKLVKIDNDRRIVLGLFNTSYQTVLESFKAVSNITATDHDIKSGDEVRKESPSMFIQSTINAIKFVTGTDLTTTIVKLPGKSEQFEPAAQILFDEFHDYLDRVLIKDRMNLVYVSDRKNRIKHTFILIKELCLRFVSEILQYHNENERDGDKLITGFSTFIDALKKEDIFQGNKGVYAADVKEFFETIEYWMTLFRECVSLVKALNLNYQAITTGIAAVTKLRESLMTILITKYLKLMDIEQPLLEKAVSMISSACQIDLKDVEAVSSYNIARTLLDYEKISEDILIKKNCNKEYVKTLALQSEKIAKALPDHGKKAEDILIMNDCNQESGETAAHQLDKKGSVSDLLSISRVTNEKQLITLMDNYIKNMKKDHQSYESLSLKEVYDLIIKTNQYMQAMQKLASMSKVGGWQVYISGIITLNDFNNRIRQHFEYCTQFINNFKKDKMFNDDKFKVLQSAIIHKDKLNTFKLQCQFADAVNQLETIVSPNFLNLISSYFIMEIDSYNYIGKLLNCKMADETKLKQFKQWIVMGNQEDDAAINNSNPAMHEHHENNSPSIESQKNVVPLLEMNVNPVVERMETSDIRRNSSSPEGYNAKIANVSASCEEQNSENDMEISMKIYSSSAASYEEINSRQMNNYSEERPEERKQNKSFVNKISSTYDKTISSLSFSKKPSPKAKSAILSSNTSGSHSESKSGFSIKSLTNRFSSTSSQTQFSMDNESISSRKNKKDETSKQYSNSLNPFANNSEPEKSAEGLKDKTILHKLMTDSHQDEKKIIIEDMDPVDNVNPLSIKEPTTSIQFESEGSKLYQQLKHDPDFSNYLPEIIQNKNQINHVDDIRDENNRTLLYRELEKRTGSNLVNNLLDKGASLLSRNGNQHFSVNVDDDCTYMIRLNDSRQWELKYYKTRAGKPESININEIPGLMNHLQSNKQMDHNISKDFITPYHEQKCFKTPLLLVAETTGFNQEQPLFFNLLDRAQTEIINPVKLSDYPVLHDFFEKFVTSIKQHLAGYANKVKNRSWYNNLHPMRAIELANIYQVLVEEVKTCNYNIMLTRLKEIQRNAVSSWNSDLYGKLEEIINESIEWKSKRILLFSAEYNKYQASLHEKKEAVTSNGQNEQKNGISKLKEENKKLNVENQKSAIEIAKLKEKLKEKEINHKRETAKIIEEYELKLKAAKQAVEPSETNGNNQTNEKIIKKLPTPKVSFFSDGSRRKQLPDIKNVTGSTMNMTS